MPSGFRKIASYGISEAFFIKISFSKVYFTDADSFSHLSDCETISRVAFIIESQEIFVIFY